MTDTPDEKLRVDLIWLDERTLGVRVRQWPAGDASPDVNIESHGCLVRLGRSYCTGTLSCPLTVYLGWSNTDDGRIHSFEAASEARDCAAAIRHAVREVNGEQAVTYRYPFIEHLE